MLSKLKSYWNYGNSFCSAELTTTSGQDTLFCVTANKKKDEFINFQFIKSDSFSELSKSLPKNQHCYLTINTQKVLIKEISFIEDNQKALSQAFPSLSITDFYYEILITKTKCFVAICRKEDVKDILKDAEEQSLEVLGFSLGFSSISKVVPLLKETDIHTSGQKFISFNGEIDSFKENKGNELINYEIDNTIVASNYLIALGGMFNYLTTPKECLSNFKENNNHLRILQNQKNFFRKGLLTGIGVLLISLLANFYLFNSFYKQLQLKQEEVQLLKSQKENYLVKSKALKGKERIVQNILNSGNSKSSFFLNRITAYKPSSILFDEIVFQPLKKTIRSDKPITYESNKIIISGQSNDKIAFSNWIETLEKFKWVTSVIVTNYGYSNKNRSSFTVHLNIKTDDTKK